MSVLTPQLIDDLREWADRVRHEAGGPMLVAADRLEQLAASNAELLAACQARLSHGHNDTCQHALLPDYPCNCGFDQAMNAIAHAQGSATLTPGRPPHDRVVHAGRVADLRGHCDPSHTAFTGAVMHYLLIHGDARRLPIDPKSIDAVVTDPPYGIRYSPAAGGNGWAQKSFHGPDLVRGDDVHFDPTPWLDFPSVILWGANHYADQLPARASWLIWDKRQEGLTNDFADCEMAWCSRGGPARMFRHLWYGAFRASERGNTRQHPTQKPVIVMRWCIKHLKLEPNSLILDPYLGSGSTAIAAIQEGHRFIGLDIERKYVAIAQRRLERPHAPIPRPGKPESYPLFGDSA